MINKSSPDSSATCKGKSLHPNALGIPATKILPVGQPSLDQLNAKTILVVEEDSMIREIMRHLLMRQGHQVLEAPDEATALRVWEKHSGPIHLLLTEVNLSEPNSGLELAEALWEEQPELHVIFTSGIPMEDWVTSQYNPAVFQFLMKPFAPSLLVETVQAGLTPPEPIDLILSDIIRAY